VREEGMDISESLGISMSREAAQKGASELLAGVKTKDRNFKRLLVPLEASSRTLRGCHRGETGGSGVVSDAIYSVGVNLLAYDGWHGGSGGHGQGRERRLQ